MAYYTGDRLGFPVPNCHYVWAGRLLLYTEYCSEVQMMLMHIHTCLFRFEPRLISTGRRAPRVKRYALPDLAPGYMYHTILPAKYFCKSLRNT